MFKYKKYLADGTYGEIHVVTDASNNEYIAKFNYSTITNSYTTIIRELEALKTVRDHPHCIQYICLDKASNYNSVRGRNIDPNVMIFEKGFCDLRKYVENNYVFDVKLCACQILLGCEFLHSQNMYHRDIKPENIIVFADDNGFQSAKLADFGMTGIVDKMSLNYCVGTSSYNPPEIVLEGMYNTKFDVWSVACVIYYMYTKQYLFPWKDEKTYLAQVAGTSCVDEKTFEFLKANYQVDSRIDCLEGFPEEMKQLLRCMLAYNVDDRYTATQCLNSPIFDEYRKVIESTRTKFSINGDGQKIDFSIVPFNIPTFDEAAVLFRKLYNNYNKRDKNVFSDNIFVHACDLYCRVRKYFTNVEILVYTCVFICHKYFKTTHHRFASDFVVNVTNLKEKIATMQEYDQKIIELPEKLIYYTDADQNIAQSVVDILEKL